MDRKSVVKIFRPRVAIPIIILTALILCASCFVAHKAIAQTSEIAKLSPESAKAQSWAFIAAAIASGISTIAAGIAVGYVGAAAVGAISEKPEVAGRALIFVGLAEGIAIYGLIVAIMILGKV